VRAEVQRGLRKIEVAAWSTRNSPIANCNTQLPITHHAPTSPKLYVNQLRSALPVVKYDPQLTGRQRMFLILISFVNEGAVMIDFEANAWSHMLSSTFSSCFA
jgi:hypothetical protein